MVLRSFVERERLNRGMFKLILKEMQLDAIQMRNMDYIHTSAFTINTEIRKVGAVLRHNKQRHHIFCGCSKP